MSDNKEDIINMMHEVASPQQEPQNDHELTAIVMDEVDGEIINYEMNVFQMVTQALFDGGHLDE